MSKKDKNQNAEPQAEAEETVSQDTETEQTVQEPEQTAQEPAQPSELEKAKADLAAEHDSYLRLCAEYDNFRKRSQKEKENLYTDIRSETVGKFLPVYDNLERALAQETADEAFKKGVEMTMTQLLDIMGKFGVERYGDVGDKFDPSVHNAVMHLDDGNFGENEIIEVFQKGFRIGEKVVRFAMVKVAN